MKLYIWGITKKYKGLSWWENFMGGHLTIGPVTIFGSNAMCWTVQIESKKYGYIQFTLPSIARIKRKWDFYFLCSPNSTTWASTYYLGSKKKSWMAYQRLKRFGHNFRSDTNIHEYNDVLENEYYEIQQRKHLKS